MSLYSDLDEIVLKCRNEKAKKYILESISCYRSGAFRASIITTWIAVLFDLIEKFNELSLSGEKNAVKLSSDFKEITSSHDLTRALNFERDILKKAKSELDMFSAIELSELERIQEDRNKCAHPSMLNEDVIFNPIAELVRMHIVNAINIVLSQPPAQGKIALDTIMHEINSALFPHDKEKALIILNNGPIKNARPSLINNLLEAVIRIVCSDDSVSEELLIKYEILLEYIRETYSAIYADKMEAKLSSILSKKIDKDCFNYIKAIVYIPNSWVHMNEAVKLKIKEFIKTQRFFIYLPYFKKISNVNSSLKSEIECILIKLNDSKFRDYIRQAKLEEPIYSDKVIEAYLDCNNYSDAMSFTVTVANYLPLMTEDQIIRLLQGIESNHSVKNNYQLSYLIEELEKLDVSGSPIVKPLFDKIR
ncbi:hypothetical protein RZ760_008555 [Providencia rettgeri]|nr:hypothetical protein [Providencia rettgeri]